MHVAELRIAQRPALARRHLDGVEDVGERDLLAVGHIGVPALSGVAEPDRSAVLKYAGQHQHFGKAGLVDLIGDVDLELAEHAPEARKFRGLEPLLGKAQRAMLAERPQDLLEVAVRNRLGQIHPLDAGAQCLTTGMDVHVLPIPQSICAPDALMIGAHFASSALMNAVACFGVLPGVGSMPASCRRLNTAGSSSALFMASLRRSTIGCGVSAGARIAFPV